MKKHFSQKIIKRQRRAARTRAKISGTATRPRLSVFRSNKHIYAQLIDDENGKTLLCVSDLEIKQKDKKTVVAGVVGKQLAQKAETVKIKEAIFDRGGYKYHGRVKALADGAREGGLKF